MFFTSLSLDGFGPHVKPCTYNFSNGITFITGDNGSGKSTIFDAIQWVLFGPSGSTRTLKNRSSIINSSRQTAKVKVKFVHDVYGDIEIARKLTTSGKHTLKIVCCDDNEEVEGGIRDKQDFISGILGNMRHDVFSSVYMLQSSPLGPPSSFIGANTTYRREILSKIVDPIDKYANLYKQTKKDLREAKKELSSSLSKKEALQEIYDNIVIPELPLKSSADIAAELHDAEQQSSSDSEKKYHRELERLDSLAEDLEGENDHLFDRYESLKKTYRENKKQKNKGVKIKKKSLRKIDTLQACREVFEFKIDSLEKRLSTEKRVVEDYTKDYALAQARHSLASLSQEDGTCALCGNDISNNNLHLVFKRQLDDISSSLNCAKKRCEDNAQKCDSLVKDHLATCEEIKESQELIHQLHRDEEALMQRMNEIKDTIRDVSASIEKNNNSLDDIYEKISSIELKIEDSEEENEHEGKIDLDALYRRKIDAQAQEEKVAHFLREQREQKEKVESAHEDVLLAQKRVDELAEEKEKTSPNGVISDDIAQLMEDMSSHSTELYHRLFESEDDIVITDGDDEEEKECIMMVGGRDVATYSHGEQLRIYGCIQAGFTLSVYDKTGVWVPMMWDEPSLAADREAVSAIFSIPEDVTPEFHQSFIITRDSSIDTGENEVIKL